MIQNLKNNMMQQPMQPQQAQQPQLNPQQQQMVAGLQKQKANLQNQYNSASKGASFFSNASQGVLDSPKDESFLASLARGINAGTQGLEGHRASQEKNLEKQTMIDQAIAQTYQFVEDYNYKRGMDKEKLAIEREKIAATREGHYLTSNASIEGSKLKAGADLEKIRQGQQKEVKQELKPYQNDFRTATNIVKEVQLIKDQLKNMNPWDALTGMAGKIDYRVLAAATGNSMEEMKVLDKRLNQLLTKGISNFVKPGIKMTNFLAGLVAETKPTPEMGTGAMLQILNDMEGQARNEIQRTEFVMQATQVGYDPFQAEQLYEKDPAKAMQMMGGGGEQQQPQQKPNPMMNNQKGDEGAPQNPVNPPRSTGNDLADRAMQDILKT